MKNNGKILIVAVTILIVTAMLIHSYENRYANSETINVTGLGKKDFKSDLIVWEANFSRKHIELKEAYKALEEDRYLIKEYLITKGLKNDEILFSSVDISKEYQTIYDKEGNSIEHKFIGNILAQTIKLESQEIEKIESIAREITELINTGIELYSENPKYYYTKLSELKIEMIAEATNDARLRAENIAQNSKAQLGNLKQANMGIFQIVGQNSDEEYFWGGTFNTSSKMKTATVTLKADFKIN
jgi:hypothetical protein